MRSARKCEGRSAGLAAELGHLRHALLVPLGRAAEVVGTADGHHARAATAIEGGPLVARIVSAVGRATEAVIASGNATLGAVRAGLAEVQTLASAADVALAVAATALGPGLAGRPVPCAGRRGAYVRLAAAGATFGGRRACEPVGHAGRLRAATAGASAAAARGPEVAKGIDGEARRNALPALALARAAVFRALACALGRAPRAGPTGYWSPCTRAPTTEVDHRIAATSERESERDREPTEARHAGDCT